MPEEDDSPSLESREIGSNSSEEEEEEEEDEEEEEIGNTPRGRNRGGGKITEYEKERDKRIEENRAKMEAMGLIKMASSVLGSCQKKRKSEKKGKKGKVGEQEDEEYVPAQEEEEEEELGCSSEEDDEFDDESYGSQRKKVKGKSSTPSRKVPKQKLPNNSDFVDDDDALMQAIALSLQGSADILDIANNVPSESAETKVISSAQRKQNKHQEDAGKRKKKNLFTSRLQMTEDELILHFFQFDEAGKGGISLRDLRRVAAAHDFIWTDKEMEDMIHYFDSDGDRKLSLDDFSKIVERCNMRKGPDNGPAGVEP